MCLEIFFTENGHIWIHNRNRDVHFLEKQDMVWGKSILLEEQKKHVTYKTRSVWDSFQSQRNGKCLQKSILAIFHVSLQIGVGPTK